MKKIITLVFILVISCSSSVEENTILDSSDENHDNHSSMKHDESHSNHEHMHHEKVETSMKNMSVEFQVSKDAMSGVNINISTTDFTFSPENVNQNHVDGEGHAHLYIDGEKWGRLYGKHLHVGNISEGHHIFEITLNTNTHEEYSIDGESIKYTLDFHY